MDRQPDEIGIYFAVTRKSSRSKQEISEKEWDKYLRTSGEFMAPDPHTGRAVWKRDGVSWLRWDTGELIADCPSGEFYFFLIVLADTLNARVRDHDGQLLPGLHEKRVVENGKSIPLATHLLQDYQQKRQIDRSRYRSLIIITVIILLAGGIYVLQG